MIPEVRGKQDLAGQKAEQQARISNMFPTPPTSVTWGGSQNSITIGINGADVKAAKDGAHVTAKADQDGAEAEVKKGDAKVGASGKWDGSEFGLKTEVGPRQVRLQGAQEGRRLGLDGRARDPALGRGGRRAARRVAAPSAARTPRSPSRSATSRAAGRRRTGSCATGWRRSSRRSTPSARSRGARSRARRCASRARRTAAAGAPASRS